MGYFHAADDELAPRHERMHVEALADSLISNPGAKVDDDVHAAWEAEIGERVAELNSGKAKTTS